MMMMMMMMMMLIMGGRCRRQSAEYSRSRSRSTSVACPPVTPIWTCVVIANCGYRQKLTFLGSRLDYCNNLLYGVSDELLRKLQVIQNAAAPVETGTPKFDHITPRTPLAARPPTQDV